MNHQDATRLLAVEEYLLNELPSHLRDEFEEHFFDCPECAANLRAMAAFLDAQIELKAVPFPEPSLIATNSERGPRLWKPAIAVSSVAVAVLFIAYQNLGAYPQLARKSAQPGAPKVLPLLSLGANGRVGHIRSLAVFSEQPFLLLVNIPTQKRFSTYTCTVYPPSGDPPWQIQVSAQQARNAIFIRMPGIGRKDGKYSLLVRGNVNASHPGAGTDLADYSFVLKNQSRTSLP